VGTFIFRSPIFFGFVIVMIVLIFGYIFFEPFITETEEVITVINTERWGTEKEKNFIFTDDEVFINTNDYYHNKDNADELFVRLKPGYTYKVKIVGVYIPFLPHFRNIIDIIDYGADEHFPAD